MHAGDRHRRHDLVFVQSGITAQLADHRLGALLGSSSGRLPGFFSFEAQSRPRPLRTRLIHIDREGEGQNPANEKDDENNVVHTSAPYRRAKKLARLLHECLFYIVTKRARVFKNGIFAPEKWRDGPELLRKK